MTNTQTTPTSPRRPSQTMINAGHRATIQNLHDRRAIWTGPSQGPRMFVEVRVSQIRTFPNGYADALVRERDGFLRFVPLSQLQIAPCPKCGTVLGSHTFELHRK